MIYPVVSRFERQTPERLGYFSYSRFLKPLSLSIGYASLEGLQSLKQAT